MNADELTKSGRVVIPRSFGITIRLQDGVGGHNLVLQGDLLLTLLSRGCNHGQVRDNLFGVLSLSSTRLTSDEHGLILSVEQHVTVGSLRDGPQMRWDFIPPLAQVQLDHSWGVDGEPLVRVDDNAEEARVGVDKLGLVPGFQVVEDGGVIEEGQVGHVVTLLKLGRVDGPTLLRLERLFLYFLGEKLRGLNYTRSDKGFQWGSFKILLTSAVLILHHYK